MHGGPKGDNIPDDSPAYAVIAALKGELHSRGFRAPGGGYPKAPNLVGRELLMEIAQAWGEKPPFLFPEKRATTPETPTTMPAQKKCEKWLIGLMGENSKPEKSKADYLMDALEEFKVSKRAFDRAWANAVSDTGNANWSKPGPRS